MAFSPLNQGILTDKYLDGIPENSRAANPYGFLKEDEVKKEKIVKVKKLNELAAERGQTMAQMAFSWILRLPEITSAVFGASDTTHIEDAVQALGQTKFSKEELQKIDDILA